MPKFNRDLINNASADHVSRAGIDILDRMQNHPQHIQPIALAAAFLMVRDNGSIVCTDPLTGNASDSAPSRWRHSSARLAA